MDTLVLKPSYRSGMDTPEPDRQSMFNEFHDRIKQLLPDIADETIAGLWLRNQESYFLGDQLDDLPARQITMVTAEEAEDLQLLVETPDAQLVRLSQPGYNRAGTEAVLELYYLCDAECGELLLIQLQKTAEGWHIVAKERLAVH
jgi:hypothetical protein